MRQPLVIANWKLNGDLKLAEAFSQRWSKLTHGEAQAQHQADVAICPPAIFLSECKRLFPSLVLGAQNCSAETSGAYTGELSAKMFADVGVKYVLLGHSERRALFAENDALIARKVQAVQAVGLTPVLCVGETIEQRRAGHAEQVILDQLEAGLVYADLSRLVIAYEPVWAIGTGETASPEQAQEIHALIRGWLTEQNAEVADKIQLLYGGSVKPANAGELFGQADIDGGLIGGASLDIEQFEAICKASQDN